MKRAFLATALLLVGLLAFASGSKEPAATGAQPGTSSTQVPQFSGNIVVSILADDYSKYAADSLIKAYNKYQPNVKISWESVSTDYPNWLSTQLAAGNVRPDIVSANYVKSYSGYADFNKYRYTTNPYTGHQWDQDFNFKHIESALTLPDGKRYLLGTQQVDIDWFYNKDIFDKVGVQPPKTWDDFAAVCAKLAAAGYTPIAIEYSYQLPGWVSQAYWQQYDQPAKEIAKSQPGDYNYDPNEPYTWNVARFYKGIRDGQIRYDTPAMAEYITNMKKIFPKYATSDMYVLTGADTYPLWLQGKVALFIDASSALARVTSDMKNLDNQQRLQELKIDPNTKLKSFAWGAFPQPPMTGGLVNAPNRVFQSITGEYIGVVDKNQQQTDMVMDFIKFWVSAPGYDAWINGYQGTDRGWQPGGPLLVNGVDVPKQFSDLFASLNMDQRGGDPMTTADRLLTTVVGGSAGVQQQAIDLFKQALDNKITPQQFGVQFEALVTNNFDKILNAINLKPELVDHPERSPTE